MNRGLQFFTPTAGEWSEYNDKVLNKRSGLTDATSNDSSSGVYLLTNSMPAFVLNLTRPNLTWCIDSNLLSRQETKINVGSSYFVMDRCVLGPRICCWHASVDKRASTYVESFAKEVSNGLRWILQIYRTTNVMQQHDLFNTDLAVAKNIRNKLAFGNYTPVRLAAPPRDDTDCVEVSMSTADESPFFVQPFGCCSGTTAPIGGAGQFARPYLGTAPVSGFCSGPDINNVVIRDPYLMNSEEIKELTGIISNNREDRVNRSYGIFTPSSGSYASGKTPVISTTNGNVRPPVLPALSPTPVHTDVPQPPNPPGVVQDYGDVDMEDTTRQFLETG